MVKKKNNPEEDEVSYRYHIRDADGQMHLGRTEAQKNVLMDAGGTVVNRIKIPGLVPKEAPPPPSPPPPEKIEEPTLPLLPQHHSRETVWTLVRC